MTNHSGFGGTVTISGTEVPLKAWNVTADIRIATTENSLSGAFELAEPSGGKKATGTINIDVDFDSSPYGAPTNLIIGATLTNLKLFQRFTSGPFYLFPVAIVTNTAEGPDHTGTNMQNLVVSFRNNGTFSYPGSITP